MPSNKDFLNILECFFRYRYGNIDFDLFPYLASRLSKFEVIPVDRKATREYSALRRLFKGKGNGLRFCYPMYRQVAHHLVGRACPGDRPGHIMHLGIFCRIEPFVALCMLVLQAVAGIDGRYVYQYIEFSGSGVLLVESDVAFKILEDTAGIIARKTDGITLRDLPAGGRQKGKGAAGQDQNSRNGIK